MLDLNGNKVLVYAQDIGGAKYIQPVVQQMFDSSKLGEDKLVFLFHPISKDLFNCIDVTDSSSGAIFDCLPISTDKWEDYLLREKFTRIICTTSSPYKDLSNSNLIVAARNLGIPTMGVMDHWKGFDRFYADGQLHYLPEQICCIDETCGDEFRKIGLSPSCIHVVGHPGLERVSSLHAEEQTIGKADNILFISQPIIGDKSFKSIFFQDAPGGGTVIAKIAEAIGQIQTDMHYKMHIRLHPKESSNDGLLPQGFALDPWMSWERSRVNHRIFIGVDSMALVEASLCGGSCVSLSFPEFAEGVNGRFPDHFTYRVASVSELMNVISKIILNANGFISKSTMPSYLECSLDRMIKSVNGFIRE